MDKLISRTDTSARTMAREQFERTGRQTSPYSIYPERETFSIIETYEREDGSRYVRSCEVSRWGDRTSAGAWVESAAPRSIPPCPKCKAPNLFCDCCHGSA